MIVRLPLHPCLHDVIRALWWWFTTLCHWGLAVRVLWYHCYAIVMMMIITFSQEAIGVIVTMY